MTMLTLRCPACHTQNRVPAERLTDKPSCGHCKQSILDNGPLEATADNFASLLNSPLPVVVDFWAPWCNPCVGFAPVFHSVSQTMQGRVQFIKINTEEQQTLASQYGIRSIPTIMVFKNGQRVDMINGALPPSQFSQWLHQAIAK